MSVTAYSLLMHCKRTGHPLRTTRFIKPDHDANFYQIIRDIGCSMFLEADRTTEYRDNVMHLQRNEETLATFNFADGELSVDERTMTYRAHGYTLRFIVNQKNSFGPGRLYISCPVLTIL